MNMSKLFTPLNKEFKKYNPEIDLLKLFFAIVVFILHFSGIPRLHTFLPRGYLAVEFFFIVSGYFMALKLRSKESPDAFSFIVKKMAPIYPVVFVSTLIAIILRMIPMADRSLNGWVTSILPSVFEMSMLWEQGIYVGRTYNNPTWYISAMIIAMGFLYPLFRKYLGYFSGVGSLLLALVCYSILFNHSPKITYYRVYWFITTLGVIRAIAGVSLGVFLYDCCSRATRCFSITALGNFSFMVLKFLCIAFVSLYALIGSEFKEAAKLDYLVIVVMFAFLFMVFTGWGSFKFLDRLDLRWCSNLSLYLYLNHYGMRHFLRDAKLDLSSGETLIVYLVGVFLSMSLCYLGVQYGGRLLRKACSYLFVRNKAS